MKISNTEELRREFTRRANAAGLDVHCAMDGSIYSNIAVIGEYPGENEVQTGLPLIGGAGRILWNALRPQGITRPDVYITNVTKRLVSSYTNQTKQLVTRHEFDHWAAMLNWELQQLPNLKYIFSLGGGAMEALTGNTGIMKWRGSVLDATLKAVDTPNAVPARNVTVVLGLNPAMVAREPKTEIIFNLDCAKLRRVLDGRHNPPVIVERINPTVKDALAFIRRLRVERLPVSFDIETIGGETACVGLANSSTEGMCIAFRGIRCNVYDIEEEMVLRRHIDGLLNDKAIKLIAQNGGFDAYWLWFKDRIRVQPLWFDTMLGHHTLYSQLPHNLGFLCTQYTDYPYYKDEGKTWKEGGDIDQFWRYNVHDVCITHAVSQRVHHELRQAGLERFFFEHVMRLQPHLIRMTVAGIKNDMPMRGRLLDLNDENSLANNVHKLRAAFFQAVIDATGDPDCQPNPNSPKQLTDLFFNRLRLVGRGTSTDEDNREAMYNHPRTTEPARKVLRAHGEYITEQKFFSTYADALIDEDGRMRCDWRQTGVQSAPGRLSSSQTLWGSGGNLQNIPRRAYPIFIADPGFVFFYFDMAQAEARVVAWLAGIDSWKKQFERARIDGKYDSHRALASEMFGIPYDEVPTFDHYSSADGHPPPPGTPENAPTRRYIAKRCRHGLNYRMQADKLSLVTGLSRADAYEAFSIYHKTTPELRVWWTGLEHEVRKHKVLYNSLGRRLIFLERLDDKSMANIVAFKPQSTIGDKVARVIYKAQDNKQWPSDAAILLNIHDALIGIAPLSKAKTCLAICKKYAEEPLIINGEELIIPMEPGISAPGEDGVHRWSTIKKLKVGEIL